MRTSRLRARQRAIALARLRHQKALHRRSIAQFGYALRGIRDARALVPYRHPAPATARGRLDPSQVYAGLPTGAEPLGAYMTRAEAVVALGQLQERSSSGIGVGLAIGLAAVAVLGLGVVVCYLLFRRKEDTSTPLAAVEPRVIEREIIREVPILSLPRRKRRKRKEERPNTPENSDSVPFYDTDDTDDTD